MKFTTIGIGKTGNKIVDNFHEFDKKHGYEISKYSIGIDITYPDLDELKNISNRIAIDQKVDQKNRKSKDSEITQKNVNEILNRLDRMSLHETEAFLIVTELNSNISINGSSLISKKLKDVYDEPVYCLGVLPSKTDENLSKLDSDISFKSLINNLDNLMLFDSEIWQKEQTWEKEKNWEKEQSEQIKGEYQEEKISQIVERFGTLFGAGEIADHKVPQSVVDSREIINTLKRGKISILGHAKEKVENKNRRIERFIKQFKSDRKEKKIKNMSSNTNIIIDLVNKASSRNLTASCDIKTTKSALLVVTGPSKYLNRKGIEKSIQWLEDKIDSKEIRFGDNPIENSENLTVTILFSGVTGISRLKELQKKADLDSKETQKDTVIDEEKEGKQKIQKKENMSHRFIEDDKGEMDPYI